MTEIVRWLSNEVQLFKNPNTRRSAVLFKSFGTGQALYFFGEQGHLQSIIIGSGLDSIQYSFITGHQGREFYLDENINNIKNILKNKKIMLTPHTGFGMLVHTTILGWAMIKDIILRRASCSKHGVDGNKCLISLLNEFYKDNPAGAKFILEYI